MPELVESLLSVAMKQTIHVFETPLVRNYWLYIVSGLMLALLVNKRGGAPGFSQSFFRREVWWSVSARNDYVLWILNPLIAVIFFQSFYNNIHTWNEHISGFFQTLSPDRVGSESWLWVLALTVFIFVVNDFCRWLAHYSFHKIPFLWEFHKTHHSAEVLNFATAERFHPVDILISSAISVLGIGVANAVFLSVAASQLAPFQILGANVLWVVANIAGGAIRHAPAWISYGPFWEQWFVSPAMHHIHHSQAERHWDRNMGSTLTLWDRMAGTYYRPDSYEDLTFGIGEETSQFRSLRALYLRPFSNLVMQALSRVGLDSRPGN